MKHFSFRRGYTSARKPITEGERTSVQTQKAFNEYILEPTVKIYRLTNEIIKAQCIVFRYEVVSCTEGRDTRLVTLWDKRHVTHERFKHPQNMKFFNQGYSVFLQHRDIGVAT